MKLDRDPSKALPRILTAVFLLALVLGPGPGSMWIDGTPENPRFLFGVPALYVWLVCVFFVMACCVVIAALAIWKDED